MKLKKALLSVIACALTFVLVSAFAACGNKGKDPEVTGITIDKQTLELDTGDSARLNATVAYSDNTTKENPTEVEWTSSSEAVTVTRGYVSAKADGQATLTAKLGDYTATCAVTVHSLVVEISQTALSVEKGETAQLSATVKRDGVALSGEQIEWSSSDAATVEVDENGLINAWLEGSATITAKRKDGTQSATCAVTVTWENKSEDIKTQMTITEQNKIKPNEWGYWADEGAWEFGNTKVNEMYTDSYTVDKTKYEPAGSGDVIALNQKVNLDFIVNDHSGRSGESNPYAQVQLAYRSAKNDSEYGVENGLLLTNHDYRLTFKLNSNVAGDIMVNPISPNRNQPVSIVAGVNNIDITFRHGDWGEIHADGNYDNIESAIFLQLGDLPLEKRAVISIYDIIWEDMGESESKTIAPGAEVSDDDYEAGTTYSADYSTLPESYMGTEEGIPADQWAFWWVGDSSWNCGAVVDMEKSIDADAKSVTATFNCNGNTNNWGVQLHYVSDNLVNGETYKLSLKISSDTAYTISVNGKAVSLEVGDNDVSFIWTAGDYVLDMSLCNVGHSEPITLTLSNLQWTQMIYKG